MNSQKVSFRKIKNDLQKALDLAKTGRVFHFGSNTGNIHRAPPVCEAVPYTGEKSALHSGVEFWVSIAAVVLSGPQAPGRPPRRSWPRES